MDYVLYSVVIHIISALLILYIIYYVSSTEVTTPLNIYFELVKTNPGSTVIGFTSPVKEKNSFIFWKYDSDTNSMIKTYVEKPLKIDGTASNSLPMGEVISETDTGFQISGIPLEFTVPDGYQYSPGGIISVKNNCKDGIKYSYVTPLYYSNAIQKSNEEVYHPKIIIDCSNDSVIFAKRNEVIDFEKYPGPSSNVKPFKYYDICTDSPVGYIHNSETSNDMIPYSPDEYSTCINGQSVRARCAENCIFSVEELRCVEILPVCLGAENHVISYNEETNEIIQCMNQQLITTVCEYGFHFFDETNVACLNPRCMDMPLKEYYNEEGTEPNTFIQQVTYCYNNNVVTLSASKRKTVIQRYSKNGSYYAKITLDLINEYVKLDENNIPKLVTVSNEEIYVNPFKAYSTSEDKDLKHFIFVEYITYINTIINFEEDLYPKDSYSACLAKYVNITPPKPYFEKFLGICFGNESRYDVLGDLIPKEIDLDTTKISIWPTYIPASYVIKNFVAITELIEEPPEMEMLPMYSDLTDEQLMEYNKNIFQGLTAQLSDGSYIIMGEPQPDNIINTKDMRNYYKREVPSRRVYYFVWNQEDTHVINNASIVYPEE